MHFSVREPGHDSRPADAALLLDLERRLIRIETRLTRLLHHFGLRSDGSPRSPERSFIQRDEL